MKKNAIIAILIGLLGLTFGAIGTYIISGSNNDENNESKKELVLENKNVTNEDGVEDIEEKEEGIKSDKDNSDVATQKNVKIEKELSNSKFLSKYKLEYEKKISEAEGKVSNINNRLQTDERLSQAEMNMLAGEKYKIYDILLNDMYKLIKNNLSPEEAKDFQEKQIEWIKYKEKEIDASYTDNGTIGGLIRNGKAEELTHSKCLEWLNKYF